MSLKIEGSEPTQISQVYPFDLPGTQKTIENSYYEFYDPSVNLSDAPSVNQRNIRWEVSGSTDMTDLKNSYILLRVNLSKTGGGGAYAVGDDLGLSAGWSQLLIDRLNMYLNGVNLSEGDHYAFKGWVASVMDEERSWASEPVYGDATSVAIKQGQGEHEGWVLDYPGLTEQNTVAQNATRSYTVDKYARNSFTIMIKPRETLFLQDDFLLPQIKMKLEILTTAPNFWVNADTSGALVAPQMSIESARLYLKRISLTPNAERTLLTTLSSTPAKYIFPRMRYTNQVLGQVQSRQIVSLLPGPRPNRVIVFFSKTDSADPASGSIGNNPVAFSEFSNGNDFVQRIYINVAGRQFPRKELEAEAKNDIHRAYEMYRITCQNPNNPLLSLDQFNENYSIYCFNTTRSLMNDDEGILHSGAMTDVQVNVRFSAVPAVNVTMHVIAVDDGVVEVDSAGMVTKNY